MKINSLLLEDIRVSLLLFIILYIINFSIKPSFEIESLAYRFFILSAIFLFFWFFRILFHHKYGIFRDNELIINWSLIIYTICIISITIMMFFMFLDDYILYDVFDIFVCLFKVILGLFALTFISMFSIEKFIRGKNDD